MEPKCTFCSKSFKHKEDLYKHMACHFVQNPFRCGICSNSFKCSESLLEHMKEHPTDRSKATDAVKNKIEPPLEINVEDETNHSLTIPEEKEEFDSCPNIQNAESIDTDSYCSPCEIRFITHVKLDEHKQKHHQKKFLCAVCGRIKSKVGEMAKHIKEFHNVQNMYMCSECSLCFATMIKLKVHMQEHEKYPLKCLQCSSTFRTSSELKIHQKRIHIDQKLYHHCHICSVNFFESNALNRHISLKHENLHLVICDFCNHISADTREVIEHNRNVHSIVLKLLRCSYCDYETTRFFFLERHLKFQHKPLDADGDVEFDDLQCFVCSTSYETRKELENHREMDHVICNECGMEFNSDENLKIHERDHECVCGNCEQIFASHDQWFEHWQNQHAAQIEEIIDSDSDVEFIG